MSYPYRATKSGDVVASFLASRARKEGGRILRGVKHPPPRYVSPPTTELAKEWRSYLLTHLRTRVPRWPSEIHRDVCDDYGWVSIRRIERALNRLRDDGLVKRVEGGWVRT